VELTGGYRFHVKGLEFLRPYADGGVGWYSYKETCTAEVAVCAAVDGATTASHTGFVLHGGAEIRLHRWVGVSADLQYTHITGILGQDGASKAFGESDLGGLGGRFRVIVGR